MPDPASVNLRDHLAHDVLGWWLRHGPDEEHGGVFSCWDNTGERMLSTDKYIWSQGRWIWVMARTADALRRGVLEPTDELTEERCLALARSTARFVIKNALLTDHTLAYVTDRAGTPYEPQPGSGLHTSVFTDCFAALGLAALAWVADDGDAASMAELILHSAEDRIFAGRARSEPYPVHPHFTPFVQPMILVRTAAEVHRATKSPFSAEVTARAATTISRGLHCNDEILELRPRKDGLSDTLLARHRNPGHMLECVWFLAQAADTVPGVAETLDGGDWLPRVARHALRIGWDEVDGGLFRCVDANGGAPQGRLLDDPYEKLVRETWETKLWWVHAEALYATAMLSRRYGDEQLARWHEKVRAYTFSTFPAGPGKDWIQIRDRAGTPLDRVVALPVKDSLHIPRSLLYLIELESDDHGEPSPGREAEPTGDKAESKGS